MKIYFCYNQEVHMVDENDYVEIFRHLKKLPATTYRKLGREILEHLSKVLGLEKIVE